MHFNLTYIMRWTHSHITYIYFFSVDIHMCSKDSHAISLTVFTLTKRTKALDIFCDFVYFCVGVNQCPSIGPWLSPLIFVALTTDKSTRLFGDTSVVMIHVAIPWNEMKNCTTVNPRHLNQQTLVFISSVLWPWPLTFISDLCSNFADSWWSSCVFC